MSAEGASFYRGPGGRASPRNVLDFYSLKSYLLGFRVIQTEYWSDFNWDSVYIIKNMFNMTDFRKTMEIDVDLHLRI